MNINTHGSISHLHAIPYRYDYLCIHGIKYSDNLFIFCPLFSCMRVRLCVTACMFSPYLFDPWPKFHTLSITFYHLIVSPTSAMHIEYRTSKPLASVIFATHFKDCFDQFFLQCNSLKTGRFFLPLFWNNHLKNKNKIKHQQQRRWSKKNGTSDSELNNFYISLYIYIITQLINMYYVCCVSIWQAAYFMLSMLFTIYLMQASTCELEIFNRCSLDKRFPVARKYNRNLYSCWMFRLLVIAPPPPATIDSIHWWPAAYAIASDFVWMIVLMLVLVLMHTLDDIIWCIRWI